MARGTDIQPIFLLSLPRSGSTLVQRILAADPAVATASEPWLLLPLLYALRERGVIADYGHHLAAMALNDFCRGLPGGVDRYLAEVRELALRLYRAAAGPEADLLLDKTPRYHLVVDELFRVFPDARFVFLWRNPLAVVGSLMESISGGRWNLYRMRIDLFDGVANLARAHAVHGAAACSLRYEDLVTDPVREVARLRSFLGLRDDPGVLERFSDVTLRGRLGDTTGVRQYSRVSAASVEKWKATLNNPIRKAWARRYLTWIGADRLERMGYNLGDLSKQLEQVPPTLRRVASDVGRAAYGNIVWPRLTKRRSAA